MLHLTPAACTFLRKEKNLLILSSGFPKVLVFSFLWPDLNNYHIQSPAARLATTLTAQCWKEKGITHYCKTENTQQACKGDLISPTSFLGRFCVLVIQTVGNCLCFLETEEFLKIRKFNLGGDSCQMQKKLSIDPTAVNEGLLLYYYFIYFNRTSRTKNIQKTWTLQET